MTFISKKTIAALALVFMLGITPNAMTETVINNPGITLTQTGKEANQPVFHLNIPNMAKELYFITITDQNNVVLYDETAKGENISRRFRLNTEDLNDGVLRVTVTTRKTAKPSLFEIKLHTRQVPEAEVNVVK
jgi:hypothetical protein